MGKRHHSKDNKNLDNTYLYILFAIFSLINSMKSKNFSFQERSSEEKLYMPVNTDSLIESYKKTLSESLEIPADKNSMTKIEPYNINQSDNDAKEPCKTSVVSEILPLCENMPHTSDTVKVPVVIKIPVVLTECRAAIAVESSIKLEDNVSEIKGIRKHVYLNQCKLAPNSENRDPNTSILFIDGFINENIKYLSKETSGKENLKGNLKYTTFQIPFKCATRVTFNTCPKFKSNVPQDEADILDSNNPKQSLRQSEFFNEKVFCELIKAEIAESHILENRADKDCKSTMEQTFHSITEKATLFLTLELLQNQHVKIS